LTTVVVPKSRWVTSTKAVVGQRNYLAPNASLPREPARESALSLAVEALTFGALDLPSAEQLLAVLGVDS
jgi:hypothetical protein